jgi:hypothetical protein
MPKSPKIRCLGCGRMVREHPEAKVQHILKYHPQAPLKRIAGLFNPALFEWMGYQIGQRLRGLL